MNVNFDSEFDQKIEVGSKSKLLTQTNSYLEFKLVV